MSICKHCKSTNTNYLEKSTIECYDCGETSIDSVLKSIERVFNVINNSLFTINGKLDYFRLMDCLEKLCSLIEEYEGETECIWSMGEYGDCTLDDLIIGAYWHFTEWHSGQASKSYSTMCILGGIYSPGCEDVDEENAAYQMLNEMANVYYEAC